MATTDREAQKKQVNLKTLTVGDLTWVDIVQPTKDTAEYLGEQYNFHPMDLEDTLSARQLTKIEEYPRYLFIVFHFQAYEKMTRISMRKQWSVFVGENYLITLHPPEFKTTDDVFRECGLNAEARADYMGHGPGYLLYQILDRAVDSYFPVLDKIASMLSDIEDSVFSEQVEAAQELSTLRRDIVTQRRVMFPTRTLLQELENKIKRFSKLDLTIYYSDLLDHVNRICEALDESTETIEIYKDADYLLSSYRANRGIRIQTFLLTVVLPLVALYGLFFMYVELRGVDQTAPELFPLMLLVVVAVIGTILVIFRRKRYV